jgi:hypothetical protein
MALRVLGALDPTLILRVYAGSEVIFAYFYAFLSLLLILLTTLVMQHMLPTIMIRFVRL